MRDSYLISLALPVPFSKIKQGQQVRLASYATEKRSPGNVNKIHFKEQENSLFMLSQVSTHKSVIYYSTQGNMTPASSGFYFVVGGIVTQNEEMTQDLEMLISVPVVGLQRAGEEKREWKHKREGSKERGQEGCPKRRQVGGRGWHCCPGFNSLDYF